MGSIYALHFGGKRRYIGSAINFKRRLYSHLSALRRGVHHCRFLQRAANKHGIENLVAVILLDDIEPSFLIAEEQKLIDANRGLLYNGSLLAGSRLGRKDSPKEIERKRIAWTGNTFRRGKKLTPEQRDKLMAAQSKARAEGQYPKPDAAGLKRFIDDVADGVVPNPWRRSFAEISPVLKDLAVTKSFGATGINMGIQSQKVRAIYRNARADINLAMNGRMMPPPRRESQPFIHPDWFDVLEMQLCNI